jgi:hypothetical protein
MATLATLAAMLLGGCRAAVEAHAPTSAEARMAAGQVAAGVEHRFDRPTRDGRYEHARMRIARYALAPSKLDDDTIWSVVRGSRRELIARGRLTNDRYRFQSAGAVPMPDRVGDSRHFVALDTLPDGDWLWTTQVDHAIGAVTPDAIRSVFAALLRSAERPPNAIRADYLSHAPRLSASLGRLATLDTVRTARLADGSTLVTLGIRLHPDRIASAFPDFAKYLRQYVSPARYRIALRDRAVPGVHANDTWFVAEADDDLLRFHFRSRGGALQPLDGPLRSMPDTLTLHMEAAVKFGPFTVGVRDLRARFAFVRGEEQVGWTLTFDEEPEWQLPPIAGRMVRSPLRRPFQGDGASLRLTVKRLPTGQSAIHRHSMVAVHESTIVRWLGNLGFTAMDDFAGRVELEEARFIAEAMRAMRQDVAVLPARN